MSRYTVIGHHLAQHEELSLTAIGLATHIQSLPEGSKVGIDDLAAKFTEGRARIGAALRELETYGYLERVKVRLPNGRIVTRTTSYNKPPHLRGQATEQPPPPEPEPVRAEAQRTEPQPRAPRPQHRHLRAVRPDPQDPDPDPAPVRTPAADLLAGLRRHDPRLVLTEPDVRRLAPAATAWLQRGMTPGDVQRALTAGLPADPIVRPASLVAYRLKHFLPAALPPRPQLPPLDPPPRTLPLQNCDGCDRAFRAAEPGMCRDCGAAGAAAAA
ncbi:helix-turn-helix domain-containing protein [Streptomyces sp. VRA16 Mangrove soil]|uniref:helix-turn-helix domain-containing protein n=1 Tax=Streptomyces sp. VRA16 Mangrove soil TaxID=2817434 RepID=UPI001E30115C|nr:helix-turn-helix domain-containing protein [Streptomyces sp. VRA16 Mangrove soil]